MSFAAMVEDNPRGSTRGGNQKPDNTPIFVFICIMYLSVTRFRTGWVRPFLNLNLALLRGAALVATNTCLFWFWPRGGRTLREPWCVDRAGHLLVPWIIPSRGRLNRDSVGHRQANRQNHSFATIHLHSFMKFFLIILKARKCYVMLCSYSKNESR